MPEFGNENGDRELHDDIAEPVRKTRQAKGRKGANGLREFLQERRIVKQRLKRRLVRVRPFEHMRAVPEIILEYIIQWDVSRKSGGINCVDAGVSLPICNGWPAGRHSLAVPSS